MIKDLKKAQIPYSNFLWNSNASFGKELSPRQPKEVLVGQIGSIDPDSVISESLCDSEDEKNELESLKLVTQMLDAKVLENSQLTQKLETTENLLNMAIKELCESQKSFSKIQESIFTLQTFVQKYGLGDQI